MLVREKIMYEPADEYRNIVIYLPDDLDETKQYPVMYINDGQNAFVDEEAFGQKSWGFADYAVAHELDIIMVAIPCGSAPFQRENEYGPWLIDEDLSFHETHIPDYIIGGQGDDYVRWLIEVLKPLIDETYPTDPADTAIVGSSMGAVISAYATLAYPDVFPKCAALSTAFWFYENEFAQLIENQDLSPIQCFYFDIGSDEGCGDDEANEWYRSANANILMQLQPRIENLHFRYVGGASHNEWAWAKRVDNFMQLFYAEDE